LRGAAYIGLSTTAKYLQGAAGISLSAKIKYLRRSMSGAAGNGPGTTIKTCAAPLASALAQRSSACSAKRAPPRLAL
jgi:hypothetical protein